MQLTGAGAVDFVAAEIDYRMTARILERPEFATGATEEELEEFTEAVIPIKVSGSLLDPSIAPDIETMLRKEVEEEIRDVLLEKLFGEELTEEEKAEKKKKRQERKERRKKRKEEKQE